MTEIPYEIQSPADLWERAITTAPDLTVWGLDHATGGMPIEEDRFICMIDMCARWIQKQPLTESCDWHSYSNKCIVEQETKMYVTQGAFIAAGIGLGLKWLRLRKIAQSPGAAVFNIKVRHCPTS